MALIYSEHTYQNGHRNALQPLSLEYAKPRDITNHAARWRGLVSELEDAPDFGKLFLLLGRPNRLMLGYTEEHEEAYKNSVRTLKKMTIPHEIVEEEEADFAKDLAAEMIAHGYDLG